MRIAYITPYQGKTLIERRPVVANRSMSNAVKIELISRLLHSKGHDVEVFSYGEVERAEFRFYPAFQDPDPFHPDIPVHYISALPIRRIYGLWAQSRTRELLHRRHRASPFDVIIIFNFKPPQLASARYAVRHGIPLILEYEDDAFRSMAWEPDKGLLTRYYHRTYRRILASIAGCMAVTPYLLSHAPAAVPKLLLRGVVGDDVVAASDRFRNSKRNIVLFSGTHISWNGPEELIRAWRSLSLPGWELHITGYGDMTESLREMTRDTSGIVFHGLVSRAQLVDLMASAKVCVSPQRVSDRPGDQFPFKVIEYLAAGAHVLMTPMGGLETDMEQGITYMPDNNPATIAAALTQVIAEQKYLRTSASLVQLRYGQTEVSASIDRLLTSAVGLRRGGATAPASNVGVHDNQRSHAQGDSAR